MAGSSTPYSNHEKSALPDDHARGRPWHRGPATTPTAVVDVTPGTHPPASGPAPQAPPLSSGNDARPPPRVCPTPTGSTYSTPLTHSPGRVCQCRCKTPHLCRSKIPQFVDGGRSLRLAELHSTEDAVRLVSTDGGSQGDYLGESIHASRTSCTRRFHQRHCPTNGTGPEDGPASPGRGDPATVVRTESAARLVTGPVYCVSASPA